ncbi:DUF2961 domain-containing protein [Aquisphaera insulae]|uniref:DUF2961 domain-containing protein n=1 Tax=Aquisphaera insulae TaxID=2712864 RepID=UPI0013ED84D4|nr:DUF2961 domain-containing protein [Aquisphaera insulae]
MSNKHASFRVAAITGGVVVMLIALPDVGADEPPVLPVGLDAVRQWERWPLLRTGVRTYMRSTYDRTGGNEGADAGHFLYQEADDANVTLDLAGPGLICFTRFNHWHGSPWAHEVDGVRRIVRESSTADPLHPDPKATFLPADLFPEPLAFTWSTTKGADLSWVPIPFEETYRLAYGRTHYGTGYYIFQRFLPGQRLSAPIRSWDFATPPAADVLELLRRSADELAPRAGGAEASGVASLRPGDAAPLSGLPAGPAMIRAVTLSAPRAQALALGRSRLRITWDDRAEPSVDAPVALFFGAGTLYNRDGREYLVRAFPVSVRFDADRVNLACVLPMPFFRSARVELIGGTDPVDDVRWSVRWSGLADPADHLAHFHATYRDHPTPEPGRDLMLLDTTRAEGGGDWSGHLVGTSFVFSHRAVLTTLEGDPRFYFDDGESPQAQGTGTEEWGGGGDYWGGRNMTLPFAGHPVGAIDAAHARDPEDLIESAYRFLLSDLMPFGKNARITLEHGGTNESTEHYETLTYWYGRPGATLIRTDSLAVGDPESERAHGYRSPDASAPYEIVSRFERGVDHLHGREIYPAQRERGRSTTGTSEFTLKLAPSNSGVMLRRRLDYAFPDQRAELDVADADAPGEPAWQPAGTWYLAGSNTCVYSNPKGELDGPQHIVQTSNRRLREDEILLPISATRGRKAIRVRVRFRPVNRPLFPGRPMAARAWSEIRYEAWCYARAERAF